MPRIECVKNNGKPYLRIVEGHYDSTLKRQKLRVLKNLGPVDRFDDGKPDFVKRFRESFKRGELEFDGIKNTNIPPQEYLYSLLQQGPQSFTGEAKNLGFIFLEKIYNELGVPETLSLVKSRSKIQYDLNGLTKLLVISRILNPNSKSATFNAKDGFYKSIISGNPSLQSVYDTLDVLADKSTTIQAKMHNRITNSSIGRKADLTYYDVTNYYFETMYGDEDVLDEDGNVTRPALRKKGVSKEHRPEPIVQMGLFMDSRGIPVSFNLFPGNTQDKTTLTQMLRTNQLLPSARTIVVADNGMHSQENLYLLAKEGNGYIVSKSVKQCWKSYQEWIEDETGYTYMRASDGTVIYKYKSRIHERILGDKHGNKITVKEKEIVYWSLAHYRREIAQNQKFIEYLESCREHPDKLKDKQRKTAEFIKITQVDRKTGEKLNARAKVELNEEKIQKYKDTMGYYMIVTSEIDTPDRDIINKYHGLSRIEDNFRIIKSDLEGRPVYVRTEEHIKAHFLICFIALTIIRLLQYKVQKNEKRDNEDLSCTDGWKEGVTAEKIKNALGAYKAMSDKNGICIVQEFNDEIQTIYNAFEVDCSLAAPTTNELNRVIREIRSKHFM